MNIWIKPIIAVMIFLLSGCGQDIITENPVSDTETTAESTVSTVPLDENTEYVWVLTDTSILRPALKSENNCTYSYDLDKYEHRLLCRYINGDDWQTCKFFSDCSRPPEVISSGEKVILDLEMKAGAKTRISFCCTSYVSCGGVKFTAAEKGGAEGCKCYSDTENRENSITEAKVEAVIPEYSNDLRRIEIRFCTDNGADVCGTVWTYDLKPVSEVGTEKLTASLSDVTWVDNGQLDFVPDFSGVRYESTAWVGIVPADTPDDEYSADKAVCARKYLTDMINGRGDSLWLDKMCGSGQYEVRIYSDDDGGELLYRKKFIAMWAGY